MACGLNQLEHVPVVGACCETLSLFGRWELLPSANSIKCDTEAAGPPQCSVLDSRVERDLAIHFMHTHSIDMRIICKDR